MVRAKLYQLKTKVGSPKCGKQSCEVCNNVTDATIFRKTVIENTFNINHSLNCDAKCLIYLVTCKQYNKQYTGKTTNQFHNRWNNYKKMLESLTGRVMCAGRLM